MLLVCFNRDSIFAENGCAASRFCLSLRWHARCLYLIERRRVCTWLAFGLSIGIHILHRNLRHKLLWKDELELPAEAEPHFTGGILRF